MTRVTGDPFRGRKVKGQGHQAALGGCSSHHLQGWGHIVSVAPQTAELVK